MSYWNRLLKIKNNHPSEEIRVKAEKLLHQYNTEGEKLQIKVRFFLDDYEQ